MLNVGKVKSRKLHSFLTVPETEIDRLSQRMYVAGNKAVLSRNLHGYSGGGTIKIIRVRQLLFVFTLAFIFSGAVSAQAATCVPIDYLKPPMNTPTLYLINDQNYNQTVLIYKGGNSPWSVKVISGSLPPGITLKVVPFTGGYALDGYSGDVYIVGQSTAEGDYFPTFQLTDSCPNGVQSKTYKLQLQTRCGKLRFPDGIKLPPAVLGKPYSFQFKTSCDPNYESQGFSAYQGILPPGLKLSDTGLLSGTATKVDNYTLYI